MFTLDQVKAAHSKVKSGADFPPYIRAIKALGVTHYETYVVDGHIDYHGANNFTVRLPAMFEPVSIAAMPNAEAFKHGLEAHQRGETGFPTFISMCAELGIEKWEIDIQK